MKIPVNEIFYTIQCEGAYAGTPAVFIRLQGCIVGCPWCDTKHTWELNNPVNDLDKILAPHKKSNEFMWMSADHIKKVVNDIEPGCHIVITGGEPLSHDLWYLIDELLGRHTVQIETSGTYLISLPDETYITVSPKFNMPGGLKVLTSSMERADEIKLVVGKMQDILRWDSLGIKHERIFLQPLSMNKKATELCINTAKIRRWNLSIQTHSIIGIR